MKDLENLVVSRLKNVSTVQHRTGTIISMKDRESCAISFSLGGEVVYTQNGESFVSDKATVIFHPKGASYEMRCTKGGAFALVNFYTAEDFIERFTAVKVSDIKPFKARFYELKEAVFTGASRPRKLSLVYEIIEQILNDRRLDENAVLAVATDEVHKRYINSAFGVKELASLVHVSESYLRKLFSVILGVSPKKYIMDFRIKRAKNMLLEGRGNVSFIASECGFASVYNFCRAFKEVVGETPTEYKRNHSLATQL